MGSAVVAERTAENAPELTVDQRVGRAAWHGVLIGLVGMTALGTGLGLATGYDMIGSLGLGAFAGVWGGPGFGGMVGAVLAYARAEHRQSGHDVIAIEAGQRNPRGPVQTTTRIAQDPRRARHEVTG